MEIIRGLHNLGTRHRGVAVTIGNFDGVHLGHRAVLDQLTDVGSRLGVATTLVTFELGFEILPGTAPTPEPVDDSHPFEVEGVVNPGS